MITALDEAGLQILLDAAINGFVILALTEALILLWKRASAATRHSLRFLAIVAVAVLPIVGYWSPATQSPIWTVGTQRVSGNEIALTLQLAPKKPTTLAPTPPNLRSDLRAQPALLAPKIEISRAWASIALLAWALGAALSFIPLALGFLDRRRLSRSAAPDTSKEWETLVAEANQIHSIGRPVRILQSEDAFIPITWGLLRPIILMPSCADVWSPERRRMVLTHEMAHIKRLDCATQLVAHVACALQWFNPLIWHSARAMRLDREQACDDLVLKTDAKASTYASHLVEIATNLRTARLSAGIPMARPSQLEQRVGALLSTARSRGTPSLTLRISMACTAIALVVGVAAQKAERSDKSVLRESQITKLKEFSAQKERHAEALLEKSKEDFFPEFRTFFEAAKKGDWETVTNLYADFHTRHSQYSGATGDLPHTPYWNTVLEVCLAYRDVTWGEPEHVQLAIDGFLQSIPNGAVYFGGTDPGRGLPTAFSKNHVEANPFFTLSQNPLADATYLDYLRMTYGPKLYTPTADDSQTAFGDYIKDATARYHAGKLKPGENVQIDPDGSRTHVSGQIAVMEINARLAKIIFDKNPDRSFFIEESFPLDWMYPHLSPAGQVMKINRQPLAKLSEESITKDYAYWNERLQRFLGTPLKDGLSMNEFLSFIDQIYVRHQLPSKADPKFFSNDWAQRAFSKWRSAIAGVYAWRVGSTQDTNDRERMKKAAEFALRQSYALCPISPEAIHRYANFLTDTSRTADAITLIEISLKISPNIGSAQALLEKLRVKSE